MKPSHFAILTFISVSAYGCAPISRESCINDSSYDIGFAAAMDNAERTDRLRQVSKICGKEGRAVEADGYDQGFDAGTRTFCAVDNGYRWGIRGRSYNGVCADPAFGAAYDDGFSVYKLEQRRNAISERLEEIRSRLATIAKLFDEEKTMTEERRRELLRKQDELFLERSDLLAERRGLSR